MIFFLVVVLIGTLYPIALEVLSGQKISVGPPYYNIVLAPFLIPFLFFLSYGPQTKWLSSQQENKKKNLVIFLITIIIVLSFFFLSDTKSILINLILVSSIYLIIQTILDFFLSFKKSFKIFMEMIYQELFLILGLDC